MNLIAAAKPSVEMLNTMSQVGLSIVALLSLGLMLSIILTAKSKTKK